MDANSTLWTIIITVQVTWLDINFFLCVHEVSKMNSTKSNSLQRISAEFYPPCLSFDIREQLTGPRVNAEIITGSYLQQNTRWG